MKKEFNITKFINKLTNSCKQVDIKEFEANEVITTFLVNRNQFCVLLEGNAQLVTYDDNGNKKILYFYQANDVFGEAFFKIYTNRELFVIAKKKCKVLFYPYDVSKHCSNNCLYHYDIIRELPDLILHSISNQNFRVLLLSKKSVREKLLTYFNSQLSGNKNKTFELPFSLTDLAEYLMIERTAMMREIKRLKEENIIKKVKNKITLCP